jgi:hypothetical protein
VLRLINIGQNPIVWHGVDPDVVFSDDDIKKLQAEFDIIFSHHDMTKLKPGDRVDCRVKSATIVSPYKSYDEVKTFEIVATDKHGYYLYVPHYYCLKGTIVANKYQCGTLGIDKKFLDENIVYVQENMIALVHDRMDGLSCAICREFYQYAVSNQSDGTLICYSCRQNPYR